MFKKIFFVFLVLISSVFAENLAPFTSVTTNVTIDGTIDLAYLSTEQSKLDYFEASLYFYPLEFAGQEVNKLDLSSGNGQSNSDEGVNFKWTKDNTRLEYGLNAEVKTKNLFRNVDKKIPFPYNQYKTEHKNYVQEKKYIDITNDIRDKANEIVEGEDDYYEAIFKIAEWTRANIQYDLNSLTEKTVQKSSWVLDNRFGVCDELTNLFTSFLRSLKIPVRYVSGLAHSDVVGGWSPHAWSEVYFPGYGWIPFDVTFGQYGWVDAGHIKMMEGSDANEPSVEYFWRAVKVGIDKKEFDVNASLIDTGEKFIPFLDLDVKVLENLVGEGSFVPIEVIVRNNQPFYVSSLIYVAAAPGIFGDNSRGVLLKPFQEKKIYWLVSIPEKLETGFEYAGQIVVKDSLGAEGSSKIVFAKGLDVVDFFQAENKRSSLIKKEAKVLVTDLNLDCSGERNDYYKYEDLKIICIVENKGNTPLDFSLCLEDCKQMELRINEKKEESFIFDLDSYSENIFIKAFNSNLEVSDLVEVNVYDEPFFMIKTININEMDYDEKSFIEINFNVEPSIKALEVYGTSFKNLEGNQKITVPIEGWDFEIGDNVLNLEFVYFDENDVEYSFNEEVEIKINEVGFLRKIFVIFKRLI